MQTAELLKKYEPQKGELFEYERQLWQARFSPCGRFLVGSGYDATIQRWEIVDVQTEGEDAATVEYRPLAPMKGHDGWAQCIAFTGSGDRLISADSWGRVSCWNYTDVESKEPLWTRPGTIDGWIRAIAVSPDGKVVAVGGNDSVIRIVSTEDGTDVLTIEDVPDEVFGLSFHPNGRSLLSGDFKAMLREWDIQSGKQKREIEVEGLYQINHMQDSGGIRQVAFDSEGKQLAVGGMKEPAGGFAQGAPIVVVFDWETGERKHELVAGDKTDGFIYDVWFHADGFIVGAASAFPGKGKLFFWQPGDEQPFYVGKEHSNGRSVSLHPDGKRLAFMAANSANANGRPLKEGEYIGGSAKIHVLRFPEPAAT